MKNLDQQISDAYTEYVEAMKRVIEIKKQLSIAKAAADAKHNAWQHLILVKNKKDQDSLDSPSIE